MPVPFARAIITRSALPVSAALLLGFSVAVGAQPSAISTNDDQVRLDEITVTGSRIRKTDTEEAKPVLSISADELAASGITSIGDILQRLPVTGSSLNTKFNSSGNFGFPADGGGVGAGSTTISLRHLGAQRVLVLVDGLRWINETSASGVSAAVDLNTIPFSAVERVEILTDGASALYGSDAIAGVVNIITKKSQSERVVVNLYGGDSELGGGETVTIGASVGGEERRLRWFADLSYFDQQAISSAEYGPASVPIPGTGVAFGSSATPFTRSIFVNQPEGDNAGGLCPLDDNGRAQCDITAIGVASGPDFVQDFPEGFKPFTTDDRFNFAPFNLLSTPSERVNLFAQAAFDFTRDLSGYVRLSAHDRTSVNQAAPEPIFLGPGFGSGGLADTVSVDETNPFNPFGFTLDAGEGGNLILIGRRPLEGGPRIFTQKVSTLYAATGLQGTLDVFDYGWFWDLNLITARAGAVQSVQGTYNIANIAQAVGPVDDCVAPCVPLNLFGGPGTITPEMLDFIGFNEIARSQQAMDAVSVNVSGGLYALPAGSLDFAAGLEYRDLSGNYTPDPVVVRGEGNGVPSLPTSGSFNVAEAYLELAVPLLRDRPYLQALDLSLAGRFSDYSTFGTTETFKAGLRWQVTDSVLLRSTFAEGFRAPSIGELFGSPARFDATLSDPCSQPTDPDIQANCAAQGVPPNFEQANPQIGVRTGGNADLQPETADSFTAGLVYSPEWADRLPFTNVLDLELTYYDIQVNGAISALDAQTQLDRCAQTNDPAFCDGITRNATGAIDGFDNTLRNIGDIETSGYDITLNWRAPRQRWGQLGANWITTVVDDFRAVSRATGLPEPRGVGVEVANSGIPEIKSTLRVNWTDQQYSASYALRYLSELTEQCGDVASFPVCGNPDAGTNDLDATFYHDLRLGWAPDDIRGLQLSVGVNNLLDEDPPICVSCSLNGYDASNYDLPGRFGYVELNWRY
ncbi:MAG: TonB-dependent receptor [Oceanococcaceae bacterium]